MMQDRHTLKHSLYGLAAAAALALVWPIPALADTDFGPDQWPQYRLNSSNNPALDHGQAARPDDHYETSDEVRATPTVVGQHLYVGNHDSGGLFAFDLETGKTLWHNEKPHWRHAPNWVHNDMIHADGRLYVGYGNRMYQNGDVRGTGESGVMALDPETGKTQWQYTTQGEVMPAPAYWNGRILITTGDAHLIALDAESGDKQWQIKLPGWVSMSSPSVKDDRLYVGSLDSVVAVDLKEQKIAWQFEETGSFTDVPPALSDDGTLVITAVKPHCALTDEEKDQWPEAQQHSHFIYGLDAETGDLRWKKLLGNGPKQKNNTSGAPTIHDGHVYVGSPYTQSFFSFDADSGDKRWEYHVNAAIKGAPAVQDGHVYFGDTEGFLHVLNTDDGKRPTDDDDKPVEKRRLGGTAADADSVALAPGGPVVINQNLFIGSQDGNVYRIDLPKWLQGDDQDRQE